VEAALLEAHLCLKTNDLAYVRSATRSTLLTGPFIYGMIVPIGLPDLRVVIYQAICFRV
jgi:hypothetical protein